jgi:hypothetical protein
MPDPERPQDAKQKKHRCAICHTIDSSVHKRWQQLRMDNGVVFVGAKGTLKLLLQPLPEPAGSAASAASWEHNWLCGACRTRNVELSQKARQAGGQPAVSNTSAPQDQQKNDATLADANAGSAPAKQPRDEADAGDSTAAGASKKTRTYVGPLPLRRCHHFMRIALTSWPSGASRDAGLCVK